MSSGLPIWETTAGSERPTSSGIFPPDDAGGDGLGGAAGGGVTVTLVTAALYLILGGRGAGAATGSVTGGGGITMGCMVTCWLAGWLHAESSSSTRSVAAGATP